MKKETIKSCCGKSAIMYITTKPVSRHHISLFEKAGFIIPAVYLKRGLLYAQKNGFIATVTLDMNKINVRCSGNGCADLTQQFENILSQIES